MAFSRKAAASRVRDRSPVSPLKPLVPGTPEVSALPTYPLPSTELSSSSSKSTAALVRGGQDRVDTFRAKTEPWEQSGRGVGPVPSQALPLASQHSHL